MEAASLIWMDGKLLPWEEARVHVLTHTLHYGLGVFEGIRCYSTSRGRAIFRFGDHMRRLCNSARVVGIIPPYGEEELKRAVVETVRANGLPACYIRPLIYIGDGGMGINSRGIPVRCAVAVWGWGAYLGEEGIRRGIRVKISSYTSHHVNSNMTKAKVTGNYAVCQLAKQEAISFGYDEALLLDPQGAVAQGSGENIFIARRGELKTPPVHGVLEGITRATVMELAAERDLWVREEPFARDELYIADEAFFTGTAAEITPIREVDGRSIGYGEPGPITRALQEAFFQVVRGEDEAHLGWLHFV
ncbi:MAG: branched-chain amino acid transaminase [Nitrospinota bacterium]